ncbi:MAG: ATP-binding protein [Arachnia sp.]
MTDDLGALERAVAASPDAVQLRLLLARRLIDAGRGTEAAEHAAYVLNAAPDNPMAAEVLGLALALPPEPAPAPAAPVPSPAPEPAPTGAADSFDWSAAEAQLLGAPQQGEDAELPPLMGQLPDLETLRLADVGGLSDVKARLEATFLAPLRNPELRRMYKKSLRGGLLLYGPPGCGKTYLARAVAGEMGARFLSVTLADIFSMWLGESEQNVHRLFLTARLMSPVVVFLDEVDALGGRRASQSSTASVTNQLLQELDGLGLDNEGVYVIGATNRPWEIDPALRRPGRFDRLVLVSPPDEQARAAIFRHHLAERPTDGIDLAALAKGSEGLSGADIAAVCEGAAEHALMAAVSSGTVRPIRMADLKAALAEARPSTRSWFDVARTVVEYDDAGDFGELKRYMKKQRLL